MSAIKPSPKLIWTTYDLHKKTKKTARNSTKEHDVNIPGWKLITDNEQNFWRKFAWSLVFAICFFICAYQVTDRIALYASKPVSTMTVIQKNNSVKFPTYVICPYVNRMPWVMQFDKKLSGGKCQPVNLNEFLTTCNISYFNHINHFNVQNVLVNISFVQPTYSKVKYEMAIDNLTSPFGICKKITFPKLIPFKRMSNVLNIKSIDYYSRVNPLNQPLYSIYLRDDDINIKSNPVFEIDAEDDAEITYAITARQFKFLNTVESPCADTKRVQRCHSDCLEKRTLEFINSNDKLENYTKCRLPDELHLDLPNCTNENYFVAYFLFYFVPQLINYEVDCGCPKVCEEISYSLVFKNKKKTNTATTVVYFDDNVIDTVTEYYSYTIIQLLCDVGGNLGLFLGLCIPAMLEILEKAFVYIQHKSSTSST